MLPEPGKSFDLELVGTPIARRRSADLVGELIGTPLTPFTMELFADHDQGHSIGVYAVSMDNSAKNIHVSGMEPGAAGAEGDPGQCLIVKDTCTAKHLFSVENVVQ